MSEMKSNEANYEWNEQKQRNWRQQPANQLNQLHLSSLPNGKRDWELIVSWRRWLPQENSPAIKKQIICFWLAAVLAERSGNGVGLLVSFLGGLRAGPPAIAPHKEDKQPNKPTECLFFPLLSIWEWRMNDQIEKANGIQSIENEWTKWRKRVEEWKKSYLFWNGANAAWMEWMNGWAPRPSGSKSNQSFLGWAWKAKEKNWFCFAWVVFLLLLIKGAASAPRRKENQRFSWLAPLQQFNSFIVGLCCAHTLTLLVFILMRGPTHNKWREEGS